MASGSQKSAGSLLDSTQAAFRLITVQQRGILKTRQPQVLNIYLCPRTLLRTLGTSPIWELSNGPYIHTSQESGISWQPYKKEPLPVAVIIQIICDGMPGFRSSTVHLWHIHEKFMDSLCTPVFTVGFYFGKGQPSSISDILSECKSELNMTLGHIIQAGTKCVLRTLSFIV